MPTGETLVELLQCQVPQFFSSLLHREMFILRLKLLISFSYIVTNQLRVSLTNALKISVAIIDKTTNISKSFMIAGVSVEDCLNLNLKTFLILTLRWSRNIEITCYMPQLIWTHILAKPYLSNLLFTVFVLFTITVNINNLNLIAWVSLRYD